MGGYRTALACAVAIVLVAGTEVMLGQASPTWGLWSSTSASTGNTFSTLNVQPATLNSATPQTYGWVRLAWSVSPTEPLTTLSYDVLRAPHAGSYSTIASGLSEGTSEYYDVPDSDGQYDYRVKAYVSGFSANSGSLTATSDRTPPTLGITCNSGSCSPTFASSPVLVAISATDTGTGVYSVGYRVDAGSWTDVVGSGTTFNVSGGGTHTVDYRGQDVAGNVTSSTVYVSIGTTPPSIGSVAVCDRNGNPVFPGTFPGGTHTGWVTTGPTIRVYAYVTAGSSPITSVMSDFGKVGSAASPSGITLSSTGSVADRTCAGIVYPWASGDAVSGASFTTSGANLAWTDVYVTDGAAVTVHSNHLHTGNTDVDMAAPGGVGGTQKSDGATGSGEIVVRWNAVSDTALSNLAGYEVILEDAGSVTVVDAAVGATGSSCSTVTPPVATAVFPCYYYKGTSGATFTLYVRAVDNAGNKGSAQRVGNIRLP